MRLHQKISAPLIGFVLLLMLAIGGFAYHRLSGVLEHSLSHDAQMGLQNIASLLDVQRKTAEANMILLAESQMVRRYAVTEDEVYRYNLLQPALLGLMGSFRKAYPDYVEIRLILPDGFEDTRLAGPKLPNASEIEAGSAFFKQAQRARKPLFSQYAKSPDDGRYYLYVSKRLSLRDEAVDSTASEAKERGYLMFTVSMDPILERLRALRFGENGHLMLTDSMGTIIAHPDREQEGKPLPPSLRKLLLLNSDFEHTPVVLDAAGIQQYGWGMSPADNLLLAATVPQQRIQGSLQELGRNIVLITLLIIVLSVVLFSFYLRRILIRPLRNLQRVASEIGAGNLESRSDIRSDDEVGDLAQSFNKMGLELQQSRERIEDLAYHDPLTGLANRRLFSIHLETAIEEAKHHNSSFALLFVDLDNFKRVNDTLGHNVGDLLLKEIASRIKQCSRSVVGIKTQKVEESSYKISRLGGDEFSVLIPNLVHNEDAFIVARRIAKSIGTLLQLAGHELYISASIGIAIYPLDAQDATSLFMNTNVALYHAKQQGKNNFLYYSESMNRQTLERLYLETQLRSAIEQDELQLRFQPQINVAENRIVGVEALVRWHHPEKGTIPPDVFIPIAEESGLIIPIGEWILKTACQHLADWQNQGITDIKLSINLSAEQFRRTSIVDVVGEMVEKTGVSPKGLVLELTESLLMEDEPHILLKLRNLKAYGIRISLDDFGTGYSSLGYLSRYPIDELKIDKSFIDGIDSDERHTRLVAAIIEMAECLNMDVVAEGVETREQLEIVRQHGCTVIQGFLLSKPVSADELIALISHRSNVISLI